MKTYSFTSPNNNICLSNISLEDATDKALQLDKNNCYNCYNCNNCYNCSNCYNCYGCNNCNDCNYCNDCYNCCHCYNCSYCYNFYNCYSCYGCNNCNNCNDCNSCHNCNNCNYCHNCNNCYNCNDCHSCNYCNDCNSCNDWILKLKEQQLVKRISISHYNIHYSETHLKLGCKLFPIEVWKNYQSEESAALLQLNEREKQLADKYLAAILLIVEA